MPSVSSARGFGSGSEGLYLAMDTSAKEGSVAVGAWVDEESSPSRPSMKIQGARMLAAEEEHASLLVPRIQDLLREVGAETRDLRGVVVGAGPGSFTGVRVGAATAKGMAWALGVPLWAFSSLAGAVAEVEGDPLRPRMALFDARGDRVYAAAYRWTHGSLVTVLSPRATTVGRILEEELIPPGSYLMGSGALRHRSLLEDAGNLILEAPAGRPSASGILALLELDPEARPLGDPARWEPDYLRESGAERMWKTRKEWRGR